MRIYQYLKRIALTPLLTVSKVLVFFMVLTAGNDVNANDEKLKDVSEKDLRSWFSKHDGKPRLVLFFSPT